MATARATLRPLVGNEVGLGSFTGLTVNSTTDTVTIQSNALKFYGNNFFEEWWAVFPVGANGASTYEARQVGVGGFVQSTGILTVSTAYSTTVTNGVAFELYRFDPALMHQALNDALVETFSDGSLYIPRRDETLLVNNLLANSDFESTVAGGVHPSWTNVGAGITVTGDTTAIWHGAQSAKIVAGGGAAGQMTQTIALTSAIHELIGKSVMVKFHVYATAASTARIRLDWNGTDFTNSDYHSANDQWETLIVQAPVPSNATQIKVILEVVTSGTGYFDAGGLAVGPRTVRYTLPSTTLKGPYTLAVQDDFNTAEGDYTQVSGFDVEDDTSGTRYLILKEWLNSLQRLRLEGIDKLTQFTSTDTSTTEVDAPRTRLVILKAAELVCFRFYMEGAAQSTQDYLTRSKELHLMYEHARTDSTLRMRRKAAVSGMAWSYG